MAASQCWDNAQAKMLVLAIKAGKRWNFYEKNNRVWIESEREIAINLSMSHPWPNTIN